MNAVERIEAELIVFSRRLLRVESDVRRLLSFTEDKKIAVQCAAEIGFTPHVLLLPDRRNSPRGHEKQKALARALSKKGWSTSRIARVFSVSEMTVRRWLR